MKYGDRLRQLRKEKSLTMDELAKETGLSQSYISEVERNVKEPKFDKLKKLTDYYNVSIDWLLGRSNIKKSDYEVPEAVAKYLNADEEDFFKKALNNDQVVMLMKESADMSPEDLAKTIKMIKVMKDS